MKECQDINTPANPAGVSMKKLSDLRCNFSECDESCEYVGSGEGFGFFLCAMHHKAFEKNDMKILMDKEKHTLTIVMADKVH